MVRRDSSSPPGRGRSRPVRAAGRLEVRIVPGPAERERLAGLARECLPQLPPGAEPVPSERFGVLLVHVGEVAPARLAGVLESVARAAAGAPAFELVFDRIGPRPAGDQARTLCVFPSADPGRAVRELAARLAARLVRPDRRGKEPFAPALTLARWRPARAVDWERTIEPLVLAAEEIAVLSVRGAQAVELARFPLAPTPGG